MTESQANSKSTACVISGAAGSIVASRLLSSAAVTICVKFYMVTRVSVGFCRVPGMQVGGLPEPDGLRCERMCAGWTGIPCRVKSPTLCPVFPRCTLDPFLHLPGWSSY